MKAVNKLVESVYSGGMADNVHYNRNEFAILPETYTQIFSLGCVTHCFDLMSEGLQNQWPLKNF